MNALVLTERSGVTRKGNALTRQIPPPLPTQIIALLDYFYPNFQFSSITRPVYNFFYLRGRRAEGPLYCVPA